MDIDKAIKIVRETEEEKEVVPNLMIGFGIDEIQADLDEVERMMAGVKNKHTKPEIYAEDDLPFEELERVPAERQIAIMGSEIDCLRQRVDELLKCNEELKAVHEKDKAHIAWLEVRVDELGQERLMLEKQMDVVRLIFGGRTNV